MWFRFFERFQRRFMRFQRGLMGLHKLSCDLHEGFRGISEAFQCAAIIKKVICLKKKNKVSTKKDFYMKYSAHDILRYSIKFDDN